MKITDFNRVWESEYLKSRVEKITEAVADGNYESAMDMLQMFQDKVRQAQNLIKEVKNDYEKAPQGNKLVIVFDLEDDDMSFAIDVANSAISSNIELVESINKGNQEIYNKSKGLSNRNEIRETPGYTVMKSLLKD